MTNDQIKEIALANGFTIKEGLTDLKPYVYDFARALINELSSGTTPIKSVYYPNDSEVTDG